MQKFAGWPDVVMSSDSVKIAGLEVGVCLDLHLAPLQDGQTASLVVAPVDHEEECVRSVDDSQ